MFPNVQGKHLCIVPFQNNIQAADLDFFIYLAFIFMAWRGDICPKLPKIGPKKEKISESI